MKILVTGGAGFVGSHLTRELIRQGHEVTVYDDLSGNVNIKVGGADFARLDVSRTFVMPKVDIIYHLAADSIIPDENLSFFDRNVRGTYNVVEQMLRENIQNIVYSSGGTVYGELGGERNLETDLPNPTCWYGASKIASEYLISTASKKCGLNYWIYRFGNVVGAPMDHAVIHDFIEQIKRHGEIRMHGDGSQERSFTYVSDVVQALVSSSKRPIGVYNLSADGTVSINRVAEIIQGVLGCKVPVKHLEKWSWDIQTSYPDNSKLRRTGWRPKFSSEKAVSKAAKELATWIF